MSLQEFQSICIDGNVSSGKSTFCSKLKDSNSPFTFMIVEEPIQQFQKIQTSGGLDINPLCEYYKAPWDEAMAFQLHVVNCLDKVYSDLVTDFSATGHD